MLTLDIPPVNRRFDVTAAEAGEIWLAGEQLPSDTLRDGATFFQSIRRSQDGEWLIRRYRGSLPTERLQANMNREFDRLQRLGLNVISFANAPDPADPRSIYILSPWLELSECPVPDYERSITPVLWRYYQEQLGRLEDNPGAIYLGYEIVKHDQYSAHPNLKAPLLHDPEPQLVQGRFHATTNLEFLAAA